MTTPENTDPLAALFAATDMDELGKAFAAAVEEHAKKGFPVGAPAAPAKRNGVVYENDGVNADGHTISWYRVLVDGKTILWASVDNDLVTKTGPKGTTVHQIRVHNATRTASVETAGTALRGPTKEGTRIFGQSVTSFVAPRASRWIAEFYGV